MAADFICMIILFNSYLQMMQRTFKEQQDETTSQRRGIGTGLVIGPGPCMPFVSLCFGSGFRALGPL